MRLDQDHWKRLMLSFGLAENMEEYDFIIRKYSESHRAYHNINHIADCLMRLDNAQLEEADRKALEMAFWYHDVIYDSYGKENELKSAEAARKFLSTRVEDVDLVDCIYELIMITKHDQTPRTKNEALIMDIDVSILGRSEAEYLKYTQAIRQEYKLVPWFIYKRKRKAIMQEFLKRERLYFTEGYFQNYEESARRNIAKEIEELGG